MPDDTALPTPIQPAPQPEEAVPGAAPAALAQSAQAAAPVEAAASEIPPEASGEAAAPVEAQSDPLAQAQEELTVQRAANEALVRKLNEANAKLAQIAALARLD